MFTGFLASTAHFKTLLQVFNENQFRILAMVVHNSLTLLFEPFPGGFASVHLIIIRCKVAVERETHTGEDLKVACRLERGASVCYVAFSLTPEEVLLVQKHLETELFYIHHHPVF